MHLLQSYTNIPIYKYNNICVFFLFFLELIIFDTLKHPSTVFKPTLWHWSSFGSDLHQPQPPFLPLPPLLPLFSLPCSPSPSLTPPSFHLSPFTRPHHPHPLMLFCYLSFTHTLSFFTYLSRFIKGFVFYINIFAEYKNHQQYNWSGC